ncbi:uncharacterized protein LOC131630148 [Vicia villosa]|uniref:uncharacterized protein LOC131630148 n=1 Tax=Vicia villosa TaxID=3911 RepID=UPI00273BDA94|nr:uncharacterized protein LOC131630148 [Vicia villosa]
MLIAIVTESEIHKALKKISDITAPGSDGCGAKLFKATWNIVKSNILKAVHDFFENGILYKAVNNTLVTIIPKHSTTCQHIQDHIMLAYELIRAYNAKNGPPRCILQMDIKKAYDSVKWIEMEDIMAELSFPNKFIRWTMNMVKTVSCRYKMNNCVFDNLQAKRVLRQAILAASCRH